MARLGEPTSTTTLPNRKRKIFFAIFSVILFAGAIIGIVTEVNSRKTKSAADIRPLTAAAHAIVKTSCDATLYPELCYSAVSSFSGASDRLKSPKDVIEISLNVTTRATKHNYFLVKNILNTRKGLTVCEKTALHDCLELIDETLDQIRETEKDLKDYPSKKTLREQADNLKSLLSAAITNQETCLDGFSHEAAAKRLRFSLLNGQDHVEKLCSNALAMITNMTNGHIAAEEAMKPSTSPGNRKLLLWPEWLSAGDRRLLQASTVTPNVVVAADGSGNFKTVSEAVASAPEKSTKRYVIRIKAGVYRESVDVGKKKTNIMFIGDGRKKTIITGNKNVKDGSTTFQSATVAAVGQGFLARDITFQNTAGPDKHQAVALRVGSDLSAFYNCDMIGYQDTLYVHSLRQFYVNCFITGTVDFIFGNAAAVFQNCDIHARRPGASQQNMLTAQGRTDPNQNTGIVIQKSRIAATSDLQPVQASFRTYLGRPWKLYSRTVVMQSTIGDLIDPVGWHEWDGTFAVNTLTYREYQNSGPGSGTSKRVTWKGFKVMTSATEAQIYSPGTFIAGGSWLSGTTFPFSLGL
ncbi:unnamed protein product [Cuscuta epithymum]|uniref:Pectinesterase n=1 Tax=Cuscuta epithymum TaxID=186058 RepID=A0AAV0D1E9_9ASTE|nr:unnamed protein product [Cuscuta epithymum]